MEYAVNNCCLFKFCRNTSHKSADNENGQRKSYLKKLLHGEAFDRKGLIYGMGHAVYSLSDPREVVFKG